MRAAWAGLLADSAATLVTESDINYDALFGANPSSYERHWLCG